MPTWVVTGSNRGLGLEFCRQLTSASNDDPITVLALVRSTSKTDLTALTSLSDPDKSIHTLVIHECDTSSATSIDAFAEQLSSTNLPDGKINYLLNNAGINSVPDQSALTLTASDMHSHIDTNVLGPALLIQHLLPLLATNAVILNMTSGLGSFGKGTRNDAKTAYSISKAALNMFSAHLATEKEIADKKIRVLAMDPGWVK